MAIVSEEDHPDADRAASMPGRRRSRGRAERGCCRPACEELPAAPAREVDPTGAGDVFGLVLTLELAHGTPPAAAGRAAAEAAARVVEGPGLGTLSDSER